MKVDKAVCTNDTLDDLTKAVKYEAVFSTLVENKILAIKRDCEEKKKAKREKRKAFGRIFFGKRIFGGGSGADGGESGSSTSKKITSHDSGSGGGGVSNVESIDVEKGIKTELSSAATTSAFQQHGSSGGGEQQKLHSRIVEATTSGRGSITSSIIQTAIQYEEEKVTKEDIESDPDISLTLAKNPPHLDTITIKDDSNGSNENGSLTERMGARDLIVEVLTHRHHGYNYDDNDKCYNPTSTSNNNNVVMGKDSVTTVTAATKNSIAVLNLIDKNVDTSSLDSVRLDEDTSTLAEDSITSIKASIESLSYPSSRCTVSAGVGATSLLYNEKERSRLRILEAKSISAQCSPILPRQQKSPPPPPSPPSSISFVQQQRQQQYLQQQQQNIMQFDAGNKLLQSQVSYSDNHQNGHDTINRYFSRQNTSEDSANLTISTLLNEADSINNALLGSERKSKSTSLLVITDNDNKKAINRLDSNSIVSYQSNPLVRGLISSLNQLTTTSSHFPVITTTITTSPTLASETPTAAIAGAASSSLSTAPGAAIVSGTIISSDTSKLQRMTSTSTGSSVAPTGCCTTKSNKEKEKRIKSDWQSEQTGSDDEYRKRKRKYKRYHRCSDPVLVYPTSGGLQHCILSMPPNQPIQFHYNDDFVYDMTLQVEPDKNGELQAIVPSQRSKRHRHHKHKKRHRHKKPKILVHDLDTQSVKVIDPDDLPQRARWTIIATACLLLVMCLMLVGITLRMAPIIDDMDPRHKLETFDLTPWGLEMKEERMKQFKILYEKYQLQEPIEELSIEDEEMSQDDEDAINFNKLYSVPSSLTASQQPNKELEQYLSQPRTTSNENILLWWKRNQLQFPILAKMARDFLSIPATSVPAERLFSKASFVIRKHRNRLNNESARWLLCLNSWSNKI